MRLTSIHLDADQVAMLDRLAKDEGVSRAELIRRLLDRALTRSDDLTADIAAIGESFGVLQDVDILACGPGDREAHPCAYVADRFVILLDIDILNGHVPGATRRSCATGVDPS